MSIFSLFLGCIKKIKRSRLRRIMRGYRVLKQSGQIDLIAKVKEALTEQEFSLSAKDFSACLMGAGCSYGEIVVRQYLLIRIGGLGLNQALLHALGKNGGKVIFPLPKEWRVTISSYGFEVADTRSSILWHLYIFGAWLYGVLQIAKVILSGFKSLIQEHKPPKNHVYFANLSSGNLPHGINGQKSYDIVSWYLQWGGRAQSVEAVHHSVPNVPNKLIDGVDLVFQAQALPSLIGLKTVARYTAWGAMTCFIALLDCLRGRWWHALLLNQSALSAQVRFLPKSILACEYFFHNSVWIYRPLWTYDVENLGSKVNFYFYSTNCESFKTSQDLPSIPYGWKSMNWPNYLVWDNWQTEFIRKSIGYDVQIYQVGPIWFSSSAANHLPDIENAIAIFDVQPMRGSFYNILGMKIEYYIPTIANHFLGDIYQVLSESNLTMALKRKRNIGNFSHRSYQEFLDDLKEKKGFIEIDCDIAASEIINRCKAVVSMPYTSTALIARELGKPSIYYDPTGLLSKDDAAAHGIPVLSRCSELREWIAETCNAK